MMKTAQKRSALNAVVKLTPVGDDMIFREETGFPGAYDYWYSTKNPDYQIVFVEGNDYNDRTRFAIFDPKGNMLGDYYDTSEAAIRALQVYL